ncbi:hypothetical protein C8R47DRAFT_1167467 [Mycena vitilis]|nr:hypothetical protein C8R47DRAFT_1167467 [Mycena vitilis]
MHRALSILEIREIVCEQLRGPSPSLDDSGRKDFAALARCCQIFRDPALNVLWRKQTTLVPVLKCLPSDLWGETVDAYGGELRLGLRGTRRPLPEEWERCSFYARRIRELELHHRRNKFPTLAMLQMLSEYFPDDFLCPNLKSISWEPEQPFCFSYLRLFLGPKITAVSMSTPASDMPLLLSLPIRYSVLKTLTFYIFEMPPRSCSMIAQKLVGIENLTLEKIDRAALEHLSRLSFLKSLELLAPAEGDLGPSSSSCVGETPFPALRSVNFPSTTIEFAIQFSNTLLDCHLQEFTIGTEDAVTSASYARLYSAFASHICHTTLQSLTISDGEDLMEEPPAAAIAEYVISGSLLRPLFCFQNLTSLRLTPPAGFDLDDDAAWDMARSWPQIRVLQLKSCTNVDHPTSMTLHGLRAFAHCANLTELCITVNASAVPAFDGSPETLLSQRALHTFEVAASPISDPEAVARFLSALFPCLAEINTVKERLMHYLDGAEDNEEMAEARARFTRWKQVQVLLPMNAAIRQEKRDSAVFKFFLPLTAGSSSVS